MHGYPPAHPTPDIDRNPVPPPGILFDWDGCLALGGRITPAARVLLRRCAPFAAIVSNNSTHDSDTFAAMLRRVGVALPASRIVLAGMETLRHAAQDRDTPSLLIGSMAMRRAAVAMGLNLVDQQPRRILLLRDTRFGYSRLRRIVDAVADGADLVVANRDLTHPGPGGRVVPETGALLAAILACVGKDAVTAEIGKPDPLLYRRACAVLGIAVTDAVMIGDNPDTDIRGARRLGMGSILVGPRGQVSIDRLAQLPFADWPIDQNRLIDNTSNVWRSEVVARS